MLKQAQAPKLMASSASNSMSLLQQSKNRQSSLSVVTELYLILFCERLATANYADTGDSTIFL